MQSIILYIDVPIAGDFLYDQSVCWSKITNALSELCKKNESTCELGRSCLLIPLNIGLPELAEAIHYTNKAGFPYKILTVDKTEEWINYPSCKVGYTL